MPRLNHQRHQKGLKRREGRQQHADDHEFQRAAVYEGAGEHGNPEGKAGDVHVNAVGGSQKQKARQDGNGVGKGGAKRPASLHKITSEGKV